MDIKLIVTTFLAVFLAELGDKTQLATLSLSADTGRKLSVFIGSATALVATSALAVLVGDVVARYLPPKVIRLAAGLLFVALGLWMIFIRRGS